MEEKDKFVHYTCTSSALGRQLGDKENIPEELVNKLHVEQTGTSISNDPVVALIQREQALRRSKQE
ncbi:MAG: hypothetical protein UT39_C0015G0008 [Candidatus Woesebacteria bacterium GW2011_GWA1_39_21]|uniref:Uncharacterized protein n=1 Tax=Candidatus Woesebacteria bacterium GW2011_GWA1_39_21 TaxID=1618550 RepID=A0A0G0QK65_9BACT|nr:MAG: hypothetical protein UT39_C0015G0008 [Candidatus Woesebacteria bacterium GW2011_GWA1_39_21]